LFLLAEALVVAEAVGRCRGRASLTTVAETAGASKLAVRGLFFALVTATLASQLSKAGALLPAVSYRAATLAAAVAACVAALGPSTKRAADLNALLTAVFAASAVGVGLTATTSIKAGGLAFDASRLSITNAAAARRSIPTILQLLVFAETVPTVNELLDGDPPRIRAALAFGSLAPLLLEAAWACLGLGLITRGDPFEHLLGSDPTRLCAILLAGAAVATTALGSILALKSDVAPTASRPRLAALYATMPAVAVALTSPEVFFRAMDFAGAYPVAILWGVFPPLACLKLRRTTSGARTAGPDAWLVALASVSGLFVASTAARDIRGVFRLLF
jgi:tyrosine-specific transport protein